MRQGTRGKAVNLTILTAGFEVDPPLSPAVSLPSGQEEAEGKGSLQVKGTCPGLLL